MTASNPKKGGTGGAKSTSILARKIALNLVGKRGTNSMAEAARRAGAGPGIINNPNRVTKQKGFIAIMEAAGLTDNALAKAHADLMLSARIEHQTFEAISVKKTVTVDEKGRKLKKPRTDYAYRHISDEDIRAQIESVPGHRLLSISKGYKEKTAYFQVPENAVRKGAIEMGLKIKGHFAPDKLELVDDLSEEERALLDEIYGTNKDD